MRTLWVVDPSVNSPETEGVQQILENWDGRSRLFQPALNRGEGPAPGDGYDVAGIVLMGSGVSVHDSLGWQDRLSEWARPIVEGRIRRPLLGICYGHQLIAHLAGGVVADLSDTGDKRVAIEESQIVSDGLLDEGESLRVVVSHREHVVREPEGWKITARREGVPVDGLEDPARPTYSYQFHPEARHEFTRRAGLPDEAVDERLRVDGRRLLEAFRQRVRAEP
ncbi:MAG: gamma-glutamyl-gamma-aminobutyrate hydrolase family protein [Acidobacteriota bacterium]|nr:gamma-glutamyl-gamma-aminobutyrate hydrolase family protein [Acidobacteriota bacterium]MDH3786193.1 gamma-glutamyl-gamma-aminobutyrate hydrolase family protein [Acidobacteriota bacterium]